MIFYAIRHKPTGFYLPLRKTRRGNTHSNPEINCIPRLFIKRQSASMALSWWLGGRSEISYYTVGYEEPEDRVGIKTVKDESRKAEDMEIIKMDLLEAEWRGTE